MANYQSTYTGALHDSYVTKTQLINLIYPVGSIYISVNSANPSTIFGGTWVLYAQGRVLVGVGTGTDTAGNSTTLNLEDTGGEYYHVLTKAEMPAHAHTRGTMNIKGSIAGVGGQEFKFGPMSGAFYNNNEYGYYSKGTDVAHSNRYDGAHFDASRNWTGETSSEGESTAHINMQPYMAVYIWKRTG